MSDQLKACPFCGGSSSMIIHIKDDLNFAVVCQYTPSSGCGMRGPYRRSEDDAITAWNIRANDDGEAVAYCEPDNPFNESAFAWPGSGRDELRHTMPLYTHPPRAQEADEDARDAARYRLLRSHANARGDDFREGPGGTLIVGYAGDEDCCASGAELDRMVDTALSGQRGEAEHG